MGPLPCRIYVDTNLQEQESKGNQLRPNNYLMPSIASPNGATSSGHQRTTLMVALMTLHQLVPSLLVTSASDADTLP